MIYRALTNLNGSIRTAPINLKTTSSVNPIILNGSSISQMMGRININAKANGQHNAKSINQRRIAIIDFTSWIFIETKKSLQL